MVAAVAITERGRSAIRQREWLQYERAIKEASRDEDAARKALEKAHRELEKASEADRAKYEQRLAELTARLEVAEERGRRALSMAQQTRAGNVYVISNVGSFGELVFKIGMTRRLDPEDRVRELGDASVPFPFDIHAMIRAEDAPTLEKTLHSRFMLDQVNKVNPRKEFFRLQLADIKAEVDRLGLEASWTMTAACAEWRESQVLARQMEMDPAVRERWERSQVLAEEQYETEDEPLAEAG